MCVFCGRLVFTHRVTYALSELLKVGQLGGTLWPPQGNWDVIETSAVLNLAFYHITSNLTL